MVEANEVVQPQDLIKTNTGNEDIDMIIEGTNARFAKLEKPVVDRIDQLTDF